VKFKIISIIILLFLMIGFYQTPNYINWQTRVNTYLADWKKFGLEVQSLENFQVSKGSNIRLTASNLSIVSTGGDQIIKADSISFEISWFDVLRGKIAPNSLYLVNAILNLDFDQENGLKLALNQYTMPRIQLSSSTVNIQYNGRKTSVSGVENFIELSESSIKSEGLVYENTEYAANYSLSAKKENFQVSFNLLDNSYLLNYNGSFNGNVSDPVSAGDLSLQVTNLSRASFAPSLIFPYLANLLGGYVGNDTVKISGHLDIKNKAILANNLKIDAGKVAQGKLNISYDFSKQMTSAVEVQLDNFNIKKEIQGQVNKNSNSIPQFIILKEPKFFTLENIPILDTSFSLSIKTMSIDDYVVNDFVSAFSVKNGIFTLEKFSTNFTDGVSLELENFVSQKITGVDVLVGNVKLSGPDLFVPLKLFGVDPEYTKIRSDNKTNQGYQLVSKVILSPQEATLYDFNINNNGLILTGRWTSQNHDPKLGKYNIELDIANLDLSDLSDNKLADIFSSMVTKSNQKNYYTHFVPIRQISSNGLIKLTVKDSKINNSPINNFYTEINFSPSRIDFKNNKIDTDFLKLSGDVSINAMTLRPSVNIDITSDLIDLDKFSAFFADSIAKKEDDNNSLNGDSNSDYQDSQQSIWSRNQFKFFRFDKFDGNWNIKTSILKAYDYKMEQFDFSGLALNGTLYINQLKGFIMDGNLDTRGSLAMQDDLLSVSLSVAFNDFLVNDLNLPVNIGGGIGGAASLSGSLVSSGRSPFELVNNATSALTIAVRGASFSNFDMNKLIAIATLSDNKIDKDNAVSQVALAYSSGKTALDAIDGYIIVSGGLANTKDMTFTQSFSNGTIEASLDIRYMLINSLITLNFRPAINNLLSVKVSLKGDTNNLQKDITDSDVISYLRSIYNIPIPEDELRAQRLKDSLYIYQKVIN
jgi:hypothetical protein